MPSLPRSRCVTLRGKRNQSDTRHRPRIVSMRYFRDIRTAVRGRKSFAGAYKVNWLLGLGQRKLGVRRVASELRNKRVDALETNDVAQPTNERDRYGFTIPVAVHIEQMHLDRAPRIAEGWSRPEVHHPGEHAACRLCAYGVYPFGWKKFASGRERDVERRISELTAALLTGNDETAKSIRATERMGSTLEVPVRDRRSNGAR